MGRVSERPGLGTEEARDASSSRPLAPSQFSQAEVIGAAPEDEDDGDELPLDESMAVASPAPAAARKPTPASSPRVAAERRAPAAAESDAEEEERPAKRRRRRATDDAPAPRPVVGAGSKRSGPALLPMGAEQLRHLISEQPELLEPGLRVLGDEGRRQIGVGYGTEVGEIDLLGRSASGDWVVVMVAEGGAGQQLVSDVLRRVGWVRKHLCEDKEGVRAILLLESMDEELGYAAAAVADTVAFRTWRISVVFEPIEI